MAGNVTIAALDCHVGDWLVGMPEDQRVVQVQRSEDSDRHTTIHTKDGNQGRYPPGRTVLIRPDPGRTICRRWTWAATAATSAAPFGPAAPRGPIRLGHSRRLTSNRLTRRGS